MCKTKDEASTKLDKLIATMERLAVAVEASTEAQKISVSVDLGPDLEEAVRRSSAAVTSIIQTRLRPKDGDDHWINLPEVHRRA